MIFMTHNASAMIPMNRPASAVRMLAAVKLVEHDYRACTVHCIQVSGFHPTLRPGLDDLIAHEAIDR